MAAKQTQSVKRSVPHQGRSVMLTRFKLSQLKRQLREKDRKTSESKSSPIRKSPDKKLKGKCASKNKKDREEFHPNKLKRKIASKKIVLKSKHELKVIGGNGSCKRKLNLSQKGLKSPPAKRMKTCNYSDYSEQDRSQSPVYSELGFEEVIRMVDENHSLDDDDLLEILTCPSPVWWEDPPDDRYMEGPINMNSPKKTSAPKFVKVKSKKSRKKTPHKLILEPENSTNNNNIIDKHDADNIIDDATFKDINKSDDRFRNKRSKLESLLSILKNKQSDQSKCKYSNKDLEENRGDENEFSEFNSNNKTVPHRSKQESENELDDISFAYISQQDKDSLKHLENIEIPMERKSKGDVDKIDIKPALDFRKKSTNPSDALKLIKKSKCIPSYVTTNKRWRILNIKKMAENPLVQKRHAEMNFLSAKSILKEQFTEKHCTDKSRSDKQFKVIDQNDINPKTNKHNDKEYEDNKDEINTHDLSVNAQISDTNIASKENPINDDYVTIIKIVSNANDKEVIQAKLQTEEIKEEVREEIKHEHELTDKESKTLDLYFKKCKGRKRDLSKANVKDNTEVRVFTIEEEESIDEGDVIELCDNCDKDTKKSIIVPSTTDVKYCFKCSCIFDKEECDYCIRKEREKQKTQEEYIEAKSDENVDDFCILSNKNNLVDT